MKTTDLNRVLKAIRATTGDMTLQRLNTLLTIAEADPAGISLGEVGKRCGLQQSNTSKLVRSWTHLTATKQKGPAYVTAEADDMDLSTKICRLTPRGREFINTIFTEE